MKSLWEHLEDATVLVPQGDQGLQGPPGPFEYVDPPEDLYIKGEQVSCTAFPLIYIYILCLYCSSAVVTLHMSCSFSGSSRTEGCLWTSGPIGMLDQ